MSGFLRSFATPLSFVTFLGVGVTGVLMLFDVRGPLGDVHEWLGIAFLVALLLHLIRNWRGVLAMLKVPASRVIVTVVGALTAVLIVASMPLGGQGPHGGPAGHGAGIVMHRVAEVPIGTAAPALGLSGEQAVARLRQGGVEVDGPHESLAQISRDHGHPVPRLFAILLNER